MKVVNPFHYSVGTRVRDKAFLEMLKPNKGDRILDVGCGLGYFTNLLSIIGADCDGIDLDEECISYCQKYMKGSYHIGDVTKLPYNNAYYNKVLCTEVLEHIDHNELVLAEIKRVMKKGGTLAISMPCSEGIFRAFFKGIGHNNVDENSREYHWHKGYTKDEFIELLGKAGFTYKSHCYTLVAGVEIFMGLTKIVVRILQARKIDSQANALIMEKTWLWKIYTKLFPIIWWFSKLEQPLNRFLKGHMIIIEATKEKE